MKQAVGGGGGGVQWGEIDNVCSSCSARVSLAMGVEQHEKKDRIGTRKVVHADAVCTVSDSIRATQTLIVRENTCGACRVVDL